ncbi:MAG: TRAP transporter small permease [Hyphomicrobiaceae bacterium]
MIQTLLRGTVGVLGLIALGSYCFGIIARYAFAGLAPDWVEEVTVFALLWGVLIAGFLLVLGNRHLTAGIVSRFPAGPRRLLQRFGFAVALTFCAYMAWQGLALVKLDARLMEVSKSTLQLPIAPIHAIFPITMGLMALAYLWRIFRPGEMEDAHVPQGENVE